jgi:hypothetical protein
MSGFGESDARVGWADVATKDDLRSLENAVRAEIADVRVEMHDSMRRLTVTLVGAMVSIAGITFAANALV